jgi:hypothetical protein
MYLIKFNYRYIIEINYHLFLEESMSPSFATMEELVQHVEENGGVATVEMGQLRDAYGSGRLGIHVRQGIADELAKVGLGYGPPGDLPDNQWKLVRLYRKGSPVGKLIEAAHDCSSDSDRVLREAAGGNAAQTLKEIRELVCP